jgi:mRNA-degrading endonuclease toxin of MazEF toxin-antitoxin module
LDRGELFLAPFSYSDLERSKRRPVCVVSVPPYNEGPDVIAAMVTSRRLRLDRPGLGDVVIQDWQGAGLPLPSVVRTGRLQVLQRPLLEACLGRLSKEDLEAVDAALRAVLGLT